MKIAKIFMIGLLASAMAACNSDNSQEPDNGATPTPDNEEVVVTTPKEYQPIQLTYGEYRAATKSVDFGWSLFKALVNDPSNDKDITISPLSAEIALSMLANGANGATCTQILDMLGYNGMNIADVNSLNQKLTSTLTDIDNTTTLKLANAIWSVPTITPLESYKTLIADSYNAEAHSVELSKMVETVNKWCYDNTNGIIKEILDQPSDLVIANATYFKGVWSKAFDKSLTTKGKFHGVGGDSDVEYMCDNGSYRCLGDELMTAISLPFGNSAYSLNIYLPDEGVSLGECIDKISDTPHQYLPYTVYDVELSLPKFKAECLISLNDVLKSLGMTDAFDVMKADFSKLATTSMFVNTVKQSTGFEINETGGEGASVTAIEMVESSLPGPQETPFIKIDVNRPFVYSVTETSTGAIIFLGKITEL